MVVRCVVGDGDRWLLCSSLTLVCVIFLTMPGTQSPTPNPQTPFRLKRFTFRCVAAVAQAQVIRGAGGEVGVSAYANQAAVYRYVTTQIVWVFSSYLNATEGVQHYDGGELDFIAIDAPLNDLPPSHIMLPLMAGSIALAYNLPGAGSLANTSLILDRQVLARIWLGDITHWNDPDLVRLNPDLEPYMPAEAIRLAWLPGLGVTQVFARALASFIDDSDPVTAAQLRANGTLQYLPPVTGGGALGFNTTLPLLAYVDATPYTLAYFLHDASYYSALRSPIAAIVNRASYSPARLPAVHMHA